MRLVLVRHGDALSTHENPDRPLSELGIQKINAIAPVIAKDVKASHIYHSPKLRAVETATLLGQAQPSAQVLQSEGLLPEDDFETMLTIAKHSDHDTILVGHLPFMGLFAQALLGLDPDHSTLVFNPGHALCLQRHGLHFDVLWHLCPSLLL